VVVRYRARPSDRHVAERADGVVVVAADILRREIAGRVDDQRAGELHDVRSFFLGSAEGAEGFGDGSEALPE